MNKIKMVTQTWSTSSTSILQKIHIFPQIKQLKFSQELKNKPLDHVAYAPPKNKGWRMRSWIKSHTGVQVLFANQAPMDGTCGRVQSMAHIQPGTLKVHRIF